MADWWICEDEWPGPAVWIPSVSEPHIPRPNVPRNDGVLYCFTDVSPEVKAGDIYYHNDGKPLGIVMHTYRDDTGLLLACIKLTG